MTLPKRGLDGYILQDRDFSLLRGFFEARLMSSAHVASIYFAGKKEAAKKRLQKLKASGLIGERGRHANEKSALFLTRKGWALLSERGKLVEFPKLSQSAFDKRASVSELTIRHELEVMDVKAALVQAVAVGKSLSIAEFSTWPLLNQFTARRPGYTREDVLVKPDGFLRIHEEGDGGIFEHTFFLEVDRSSETQETLVNRAGCYLDYFQSGGFAIRNGATRAEFKEFPFRVLIVVKNAERRNNTAERLLQLTSPILTQVYISTFAEVVSDALGAIWVRPIDYRDAVKGAGFKTTTTRGTYRRHAKREQWVEDSVLKRKLLD